MFKRLGALCLYRPQRTHKTDSYNILNGASDHNMGNDFNKSKSCYFVHLRLKIARTVRGYGTRSAFAEAAGVAIATYRAHERGDYEAKASDIIRYTRTLDISIPWLLTGEGHPLDHQAQPDPEVLTLFLYHISLESSKIGLKKSAEDEAARLLLDADSIAKRNVTCK